MDVQNAACTPCCNRLHTKGWWEAAWIPAFIFCPYYGGQGGEERGERGGGGGRAGGPASSSLPSLLPSLLPPAPLVGAENKFEQPMWLRFALNVSPLAPGGSPHGPLATPDPCIPHQFCRLPTLYALYTPACPGESWWHCCTWHASRYRRVSAGRQTFDTTST